MSEFIRSKKRSSSKQRSAVHDQSKLDAGCSHTDSGSSCPVGKIHVLAAVLLLFASYAVADENGSYDTFTLRGFGTLGLVYNNDGDADYLRDISQPDTFGDPLSYTQDSLLGVQFEYRPHPSLGITVQALSKYRYDGSYKPEINWAFVNLRPTPATNLRLGRLGLEAFFRSDSLNIGYSLLWSRPPVDYYGHQNLLRFDGADLTQTFSLGEDNLRIKAFGGWINLKLPTVLPGEILDMNASPMYGVTGEYQAMDWTVWLGTAHMQSNTSTESVDTLVESLRLTGIAYHVPTAVSLANELDTKGKYYHYYSLGLAREEGPWRIQMAISHLDSDALSYPDNTAAFLSVGYRIERWTPYVMVAGVTTQTLSINSGLGSQVDQQIETELAKSYMDQKTLSVGSRYDLTDKMCLKLQVDRVKSKVNPSLLWANETAAWDGNATLFSTTLDFVF